MTFWRFTGTHKHDRRIVEFAWLNEFPGFFNRCAASAHMGNGGEVVETIEDLGDSDLGGSSEFGGAEITGGKGRTKADVNDRGLDDLVNIADVDNVLVIP